MDEKAPNRKIKLNINLLLGLSAVFLSASALIVSIIQTNILSEQQYKSVWPYMQVSTSSSRGSYSFGIENKGVGPAIIKDFEYTYKGQRYSQTRDVFHAMFGNNMAGIGTSEINKEFVFKSGDAVSILTVNRSDSLVNEIIYRWESDSVNLRIIYSDVYGNCWQLDNEVTTRLESCPSTDL